MNTSTSSVQAVIVMSPTAYLYAIDQATDAQGLHALRTAIMADDSLYTDRKEALMARTNHRFGQLNLAAGTNLKPRW